MATATLAIEDKDGDASGMTWLHHAVNSGNCNTVAVLANANAAWVDKRDSEGKLPITYAAQHGFILCAIFLMSSYSSSYEIPDNAGNTPAHYAAKRGYAGILSLLIHENSKVLTLQNKVGESPLSLLTLTSHYEKAELIQGDQTYTAQMANYAAGIVSIGEKIVRRLYFSRSLAEILFFTSETYCDCLRRHERDVAT